MLLKDDLQKSGPYKRDRSGMPTEESIIKMHAVIFKHTQKKIIEKELFYQEKRIQHLKDKNMAQYKNLVRKANVEYRQIEDYVTEKACALMKLDLVLYNYAFTRALQKPSMLSKIRGSDESFRRRMWKRMTSQTDKVEGINDTLKKKIYMELLTLQNTCEITCLGFDSWDQGREEMRIDLLAEQTKVGDLLFMKYKI